jgi:hypothetical protein
MLRSHAHAPLELCVAWMHNVLVMLRAVAMLDIPAPVADSAGLAGGSCASGQVGLLTRKFCCVLVHASLAFLQALARGLGSHVLIEIVCLGAIPLCGCRVGNQLVLLLLATADPNTIRRGLLRLANLAALAGIALC